MIAFADVPLPHFDHTDPGLRGDGYREAMASLEGWQGWLAACPFGVIVTEREAAEFFLRSRDTAFPGLTIAGLFGIADGPLHEEIVGNIINLGGADHRRLRNLVNPALAPRAIDRHRPAMRAFMADRLEAVASRSGATGGELDLIADIARPYPAQVIAHVLAGPAAAERDADRMHRWSTLIQGQFDPAALVAERPAIEQAVREAYAWADEVIAARRGEPGDDLVSRLLAAEAEGDRLTPGELRNLVLNLLVGGIDTSQSQLGHAVRLLAEHPDQWAALRADPAGLALAAVDEALRYEPITPFTARITTAEIEHRGVSFPAGTVVLVSAWHANRAQRGGDRFDIGAGTEPAGSSGARSGGRILTFGAGMHYCVGANLARAEMEEALIALATRWDTLEPAGPPRLRTPSGIYGLDALPVRFTAA